MEAKLRHPWTGRIAGPHPVTPISGAPQDRSIRMAPILLALGLLASTIWAAPVSAQSSNANSDLRASIDKKVPELMRRYSVPGVSVALVADEVVWSRGYGDGITKDSVFQVASISKTVTAWGVMDLVESGDVSLDDAVVEHVSWSPPSSRFDEQGVTIRRLLSHTAGISVSGVEGVEDREDLVSTKDALEGRRDNPVVRLVDEPGRAWSYSGGGYGVLQLLLEESYDEPFADVMGKRVLNPLGMKDSSFKLSDDLSARLPQAKSFDGDVAPPEHYAFKAAAGLNATVEDIARFVWFTADPGRQEVLSERSVTQMLRAQPNSQGLFDVLSGMGYGLGYAVEQLSGDKALVLHTGANPGWASLMAVAPEEDAGLVVLTNADSGLLLYGDVLCDWVPAVTDAQSGLCRSISGLRTSTMIGWALVAVALIGLAAYTTVRGDRRPRSSRRGSVLGVLVGIGSVVWLLVWHVLNLGGVNMADVVSTRFVWVTVVIEIAAVAFLVTVSRYAVPVRKLLTPVLVGALAIWILVMHTDLLGRLVLGRDGSVPRNALPLAAWTVTAILAVATMFRLVRRDRSSPP